MNNRERYPENWHSEIRPKILTRDKFKCQNCNIKQGTQGYYDKQRNFIECDEWLKNWAIKQGFKVQKIFLQIAHIDHNPMNCSDENLKSLCPACHLKNDSSINLLKRLSARKGRISPNR